MFMKKNGHDKKSHQVSQVDESLSVMKNWVRKIEQTSSSISSRLAAVEKRLSMGSTSSNGKHVHDILNNTEHKSDGVLVNKKMGKKKTLREFSDFVQTEFVEMHGQLNLYQEEMSQLNEKFDALQCTIAEFAEKISLFQQVETLVKNNVVCRLDKLERLEPPRVRVGRFEIPLEITGVVGGVLAFVIAVLVGLHQQAIVVSPWFLVGVGVLLLGSVVLKTIHIDTGLFQGVKELKSTISHPAEKVSK